MKKAISGSVVIIIIVFLNSGCAPVVEVTWFAKIPQKEIRGEIDVYTSPVNIKKQYKEVALITISDQFWRDEIDLTKILVEKAKEIGADGVIILDRESPFVGVKIERGVEIQFQSGIAIIYKDLE